MSMRAAQVVVPASEVIQHSSHLYDNFLTGNYTEGKEILELKGGNCGRTIRSFESWQFDFGIEVLMS